MVELPKAAIVAPQLRTGILELAELLSPFSNVLIRGWCFNYELRNTRQEGPKSTAQQLEEDIRYGIYSSEPLPYVGISLTACSLAFLPPQRVGIFRQVGDIAQQVQDEIENRRLHTIPNPFIFMGISLRALHSEVARHGEVSQAAQSQVVNTLLDLKNGLTLSQERLLFKGYHQKASSLPTY